MLFYFITFTIAGFFIHRFFDRNGAFIIIAISIFWGFSSGAVWGLASLGEMPLGFVIAQSFYKD